MRSLNIADLLNGELLVACEADVSPSTFSVKDCQNIVAVYSVTERKLLIWCVLKVYTMAP